MSKDKDKKPISPVFEAIPENTTVSESPQFSPNTLTGRFSTNKHSQGPLHNFTDCVNAASTRNTRAQQLRFSSPSRRDNKKSISPSHKKSIYQGLFSDNNLNQDPI